MIATWIACATLAASPKEAVLRPTDAVLRPLDAGLRPGREDVLAFAPKPESTVDKSFTLQHELVVQTMKLEGGKGEQVSQQGLEVSSEVTLEVSDTYRGLEGGQPLQLRRLYRAAGLHVDQVIADASMERRPEAWVGDSPLKSSSVVFVWVPEEKAYGRHYDEKENLEEYLGGLREDLDLRSLLPASEVREGGNWTIDPASFVDVFAAGGNVPRVFVQGGGGFLAKPMATGVAGPLSEVFGGELAGEARATWKEIREEDGVRLAVIEIQARIETKRDQSASARAAMRRDELLDERSVARASIEWKFDGDGTLLWNLAAGRFESLSLVGREEVTSDVSYESQGETESRQVLTLAGSLKVSAKAK